jgi:nitronate monooxygenase
MRTLYALRSIWQLKRASLDDTGSFEYWQAGRSVGSVSRIEPAAEIVRRFERSMQTESRSGPAPTRGS